MRLAVAVVGEVVREMVMMARDRECERASEKASERERGERGSRSEHSSAAPLLGS